MYSKWIGVGRLGKDPELKSSTGGNSWVTLSFATDRYAGKDDQGKAIRKTLWHNVVAFGKLAENIAQYTKSGSKLFIEGEYVYDEGTGENEGKRFYKVIASDVKFLDSKAEGGTTTSKPAAAAASNTSAAANDDIPF